MHITQAHYIAYIRLMCLGCQGIPQEDHQVDLIVFDLGSNLLFTTQMPRKIFVNIQIRNFLDQSSGSSCGI